MYLWKTDTQLSLPLRNCFLYSSKFGNSTGMNGPMNGSLNIGPAIDPFFLMYITGRGQQLMDQGKTLTDTDHMI